MRGDKNLLTLRRKAPKLEEEAVVLQGKGRLTVLEGHLCFEGLRRRNEKGESPRFPQPWRERKKSVRTPTGGLL